MLCQRKDPPLKPGTENKNYALAILVLVVVLVVASLFGTSCAGTSKSSSGTGQASSPNPSGPGNPSSPVSSIAISPASAMVASGGNLQFTASVNNVSSTAVTWSTSNGEVSTSGLFSAPLVSSNEDVTVTATSTADSTKKASAALTVVAQAQQPPVQSSGENRFCAPGNLPKYPSQTDGPAQLPLSCYYTGLDGTPSPGKVWSGTDLNKLYAQASCGDTILLTAGQSIQQTPKLPHKNCDDQHYITIRTSTADGLLPAEGTRISPCYFGVASLPGRPPFPLCPAGGADNLGFKIVPGLQATPVFGDHIRFIGLEFAKPPGGLWTGLDLRHSDHIILDRVWIHGNPREDARPGIRLDDTRYVALINSYLSDFHCTSWPLVSCSDAHPVGGGNDSEVGIYHGTFKIYGNFLEGSGQSILFGGGPSVDTALDIDIERNLLFKPLIWDPADPSYDGGVNGTPYIVKNHLELKNAGRVLIRGNRLMNVWAGFSQRGASIVLFAVSQSGLCPTTCQVHDVTVAYNYITNSEQAMEIYNGGSGHGWFALEGKNYSIHDLIFDGLDFPTAYIPGSGPYKVVMGNGPTAPASDILANVAINHITFVEQGSKLGGFVAVGGSLPAAQSGISWKNSVLPAGIAGVGSTGDPGSCANPPEPSPKDKLDACWRSPYVFTHNLILAGDSVEYPVWPLGNLTYVSSQASTYQNFNGGALGDYHLSASSPGKNAADDGTDIGANVDAVMQEIAGIR